MSQENWIILSLRIVLIAAEIATIGFIAVYSALAPWWKNPIGRTIVTLDALLGLAFLPSILSLFFQFSRLTSHIAAWADIGIFWLITLTLIYRSFLWVRLHRHPREGE